MTREVCAVTGATGYVGSRLAATLAQTFDVLPMSRSTGWTLGGPSVEATLRARHTQVLVHAAWAMHEPDPKTNWTTNVEGSRTLLEQAAAAGVRHLVFISTLAAFPGARSHYGRSKLAVEALVLAQGGTVVRPGLVWGPHPGGMFAALRNQAGRRPLLPTLGDGRQPQYLVHEDDLAAAVTRAATGEFPGRILTVAHPQPWPLRDLLSTLAAQQGGTVKLLPIPWQLAYTALRAAEALGLHLPFRSDSLLGLLHPNPHPNFSPELAVRGFALDQL